MASPISATSSGSISICLENSGSEENQQHVMDERKRKRMISNRESARRSRKRKQKHLDDLNAQVTQLRAENNRIVYNINLVTQLCLNIECEKSVLRAQMSELNQRLQALNDIINYMDSDRITAAGSEMEDYYYDQDGMMMMMMINGDEFLKPWSLNHVNEPVMANFPDVFMY
ncbi:bZIP transcription factor 44 [Sesamum alatum]|uniref:BZIP transcription factor 44 n=1 Tax=Sesamum alatum TaxID=300844 RepID=A0AAE1YI54_9LAMI|nr:bZIP transcription factor 44 [Sesamum alatum]